MSPAAQSFLNSMPPAEQQRIRASWGGQDLGDQWYQNAINAGAVPGTTPQQQAPSAAQQADPYAVPKTEEEKIALAQRFHDYDNSDISVAQWKKWIDEGKYKGKKQWSSDKVDESGNPIQGPVDHPDACPPGQQAYGQNQCVKEGSKPGTVGYGGPGGGQAPKPAAGGMQDQIQYTGNPLEDQLIQMFNMRAGAFGTGNPLLASATSRAGKADIKGKLLSGGGLWWGGDQPLQTSPTLPAGQPLSTKGAPTFPNPTAGGAIFNTAGTAPGGAPVSPLVNGLAGLVSNKRLTAPPQNVMAPVTPGENKNPLADAMIPFAMGRKKSPWGSFFNTGLYT